ncbi:hypothetical protein LJC59_00880 [Desulfovibrio sp. OttesenSCG-928-A18]|nr:hypothetical protein [Desulfovibrio sp. OttesenSCG-928-A18]
MKNIDDLYRAVLKPCHMASGINYAALIFVDSKKATAYAWRNANGAEDLQAFKTMYSDCGQFSYSAHAQALNFLYS